MNRFVSNHTLRLDAKGRVSIPRATGRCSRAMLSMGSIATRRSIAPALDAGGNGLLAEIETLIGRFPPYSDEREQFATALYGTSES